MKGRITQSDVARVAGVHNTTVSLALRNSRLIPVQTRERIQSVAQSLGYAPDPALRALVAYRNSRRDRPRVETLAYITQADGPVGWVPPPTQERQFAGAQRMAAELGYQLETLGLGEGASGLTARRLDQVLLHRGIRGALVAAPLASSDDLAAITWSRLSAIKIGGLPRVPALNQVTVDPNGVMRLALQHILAAGYRRIGLVLPRHSEQLSDLSWSVAFHAERYRSALEEPLPVLYLQEAADRRAGPTTPGLAAADGTALTRWFRQHRPEVIIGLSPLVHTLIRSLGLRIPADVAYVDLLQQDKGYAIAGVWENCEKVGELAVELLVKQLDQNLMGLPAIPTVTSIGGLWRDGASLPGRPESSREMLPAVTALGLASNLVA